MKIKKTESICLGFTVSPEFKQEWKDAANKYRVYMVDIAREGFYLWLREQERKQQLRIARVREERERAAQSNEEVTK